MIWFFLMGPLSQKFPILTLLCNHLPKLQSKWEVYYLHIYHPLSDIRTCRPEACPCMSLDPFEDTTPLTLSPPPFFQWEDYPSPSLPPSSPPTSVISETSPSYSPTQAVENVESDPVNLTLPLYTLPIPSRPSYYTPTLPDINPYIDIILNYHDPFTLFDIPSTFP